MYKSNSTILLIFTGGKSHLLFTFSCSTLKTETSTKVLEIMVLKLVSLKATKKGSKVGYKVCSKEDSKKDLKKIRSDVLKRI
jgi:hypothetical protein